jgi:UDP-N-acetylglucosamine/UDP-N-acetylgalactosamine diphosphorylase
MRACPEEKAMTFEQAKQVLEKNGQGHVLRFWNSLDAGGRAQLLDQVAGLDFASIVRMQEMLKAKVTAVAATEPTAPQVVELTSDARAAAYAAGEAEVRAGKVAVLLVAGGQGSRLGYEGPKGAYSIGPVTGRPLFYFHARKIVGLCRRYGVRIPFYIMTSDANDAATRAHFEDHNYFGLDRNDVTFFMQGMWPALDEAGRVILDQPGHIFMSPDGHGGTLTALEKNGCLADMARRGINTVFFFQVDNPMVEIADPAFIGLHVAHQADISVKLCAKRDPKEGLGVVVERDGRFEMVEYTELTDEQANRRTAAGELYFKYGSVAIHVFSFAFMKAEANKAMPLHIAHKKIPMCADDGTVVKPEKNSGYKFEKFIFDVLPDAKTVLNLAFDRAEEFSPVKNATGSDSPATCKYDMQAKWLRWLGAAGLQVPATAAGVPVLPVEIDPAYALDVADLMKRGLSLKAE